MIVSIEKRLFLYLSYYIKYSTEKELIIKDMRKFYNSQSVVFKNEQNYYDKLLNTTSMHIDFNNYMLDRTLRERILNLPNNKNGVNGGKKSAIDLDLIAGELKMIELYGKQMMLDIHAGNLMHKGSILIDKQIEKATA